VREPVPHSHSIHSFVDLPIIHLSICRYSEDDRTSRCWCRQIVTSYSFSPMRPRPINKPPADPQKTPSRRVLLAEDDPVAQVGLRTLLEKQGYVTVLAHNGREALARYHAELFDLVLTDVQMPEMDGLALTAALRNLEAATGAHLPIIGVTAEVKTGDREKYLTAGMDGFVSKPILPSVLIAEIEKLLGSSAR